VTNERSLYESYFAAAAGGIAGALAVAAILRRPHREAAAGAERLGRLLRRAFPAWLVLSVLLGFALVSYFDCQHKTYREVVADEDHLVTKTREQTQMMALALAIALTAYGFVLVPALWARARVLRGRRPPQGKGDVGKPLHTDIPPQLRIG
jgi:hypothetical protein